MDLDLAGKVALVTGGAAGIGAACVRELASLGASVAIADVDLTAAKPIEEELGERALLLEVDVADETGVGEMVDAVLARWGRLDVAVNNAGVGVPHKVVVDQTETNEWERIRQIDLDGSSTA